MCDSADYQNKPKKDRKTTGYLTTSSSNTDRKDTQKSQKKVKGNIC